MDTPKTKQAADDQSRRKMELMCAAADDLKARDMVVLDVRSQTILSDYFVICTGTSSTHIQSIIEAVRDRLRNDGRWRASPEGDAASFWMVLDYSDVVLHVFGEDTRKYYDLERLWADAEVLPCPMTA